jgi:hypothetical protein
VFLPHAGKNSSEYEDDDEDEDDGGPHANTPYAGTVCQDAYQRTAKKWQAVPVATNRCQMKWL